MRKMTDYPNTHNATTDTPNGTFKNESEPNKSDGTDIKAEHMQDPYYALYQILQLAGETPNGELENGNNSKQFINCLTNVGWFKYDSSIEYKKGSIVLNTINHITKIYRSQKNNNTDSLSNTSSWVNIITIDEHNIITLNTTNTDNTGVFMGAFMYGIRKDTPEGWLRCDGSEYPANVFTGFINNCLLPRKIPYLSLSEWETEYNTNNGNCGYFGYRKESIDEYNLDENGNPLIIPSLLKTPCFKDQLYIATALNSGNICKFTEAGLPNIEGERGGNTYTDGTITGAYEYTTGTNIDHGGDYAHWVNRVRFNASKSNPIYGKSNTVTTNNIGYPIFICVSNNAIPATEAQYNKFIEAISNKVSKSDLLKEATAIPTMIEQSIGEFKAITGTQVGSTVQWPLPNGGTWAYYYPGSYFYTGGVLMVRPVAGIAAGGTTIETPSVSGSIYKDSIGSSAGLLVWRIQ